MTQIMYNYSAMLDHAGNMSACAGDLHGVSIDIAAEQAALQAGWAGDTGMTYQVWQVQWNQATEEMVRAYRAMASTHQNNTLAMLARDQAEAAKWGG
ncbi:WXG100 family type VII secretion target [Mycobacterium lepromatosis]|uniref:ESAT-6-like protein n=1 Tax=Mycobacterium lepromatosis TaxID=480418 RepID=A0A0F4EPP7_9MYCO|nr:WXG100 family type VII secretion target [Mycobacterium lepromatosis]KJX74557.1 cell surface protein [Mycobacterium lepromatosis]UKN42883.1 ESAT-6-like protein EsxR [Mycobacterium lepromatosis]